MAVTYEYPRPALTTDVVLFRLAETLEVLLIQRRHSPFEGQWALPGGFLDEDETLDACARRELAEETGVTVAELHPLANFSKPGRDPRGWTVSAAYVAVAPDGTSAKAGDDAAALAWHAACGLPPLAFDHAEIVAAALAWLHIHGADRGIPAEVLPSLSLTTG